VETERLLFVLLVFTASVGCNWSAGAVPSKPQDREVVDATNKLSYGRDERTGLCFAFLESVGYAGYKTITFTNIPCEHMPVR
jgi:hypothetical protein